MSSQVNSRTASTARPQDQTSPETPASLAGVVAFTAGVVLLGAALVLMRQALRLRRRIAAASRMLHRARASATEVERVQHARDEVIGSADEVENDVLRRSYDALAGVPFALLDATPMPRETVRLLRDAHGAVTNSVYSSLWDAGHTLSLGMLDELGSGSTQREYGRTGTQDDTQHEG